MLKWVRQFLDRGPGDAANAPGQSPRIAASAASRLMEGNALLERADFAAASACYRDAIAIEPANAEAHCRLGIALKAGGDAQQAEILLARALALDATLIDAHYALGDLALTQGLPDVAATHWRHALDLAPDFEAAYLALCHLLLEKGAFDEARQLVSDGIAHVPASADLHFYLGNLQFQEQQFEAAATSYRTALDEQPQRAEILANLGLAQLELDQPDAAIASLQAAAAIDPGLAGPWNNLANACVKLGQLDGAAKAFRRVVAIEPHNVDAHFNLGNVLYSQDRIDQAVDAYRIAATLAPERQEAHTNMGSALLRQGNGMAAIESLRRALAIAPSSVLAHYNLATALQALGRADEAVAAYDAALALEPEHIESLFNLGTLLETEGDLKMALKCYEKVTALNPGHAAAYCNLGRTYQALHQLDDALACYREALHADANFTVARINMSDVLISQTIYTEAIASCDAILATQPTHADAHFNKALALLAMGDYRAGWQEYEYRWNCTGADTKPAFPPSEWDGQQSLAGKTILLYTEQGLGDTLQFIRYASLVAERGATVHVLAPKALQTLVAGCAGVAAVFTPGQLLAPFDTHCALMSLPLLLGTALPTIPTQVPYLGSSAEKNRLWQDRLGRKTALRAGLRVGLAWAGNPRKHQRAAQATDRMRSLRFDQIAPLLDVAGIEFFSLQLGDEAVAQLNGDPRVIDLTSDLHDFEDTAALMANLDLVISVDTSVVHLAGAIGKPVWVLNRYNTCWRWLTERSDSPWYPTARLFRQPSFGDWPSVIAEAKQALAELAAATRLVGNI